MRKNIVRRHMCLLANVYRDRAVWIYKYKANWMVTKEEKLPTDDFISFQLFALVNNSSHWKKKTNSLVHFSFRKSHRQPQCTLQILCENRVLFRWIDLHVSLCWQQHQTCERTIRLVHPILSRKLRYSFELNYLYPLPFPHPYLTPKYTHLRPTAPTIPFHGSIFCDLLWYYTMCFMFHLS